jgi:hypothetical protein
MKSYYAPQQLCLVGKAWEVQYYLRKLSASSNVKTQPLVAILNEKGIDPNQKSKNPFTLV